MNFRTSGILFGLVLLFGLALLVINQFTEEKAPTGALVEELDKAGVKPDDIESVEIERGNPPATIKFTRLGKESWQMTEPVTARADANAVNGVIKALFQVRPTVVPDLSSDPSVYGLTPPTLRVTLRGKGVSSTLQVGDVPLPGKITYVTTSTRNRPMAVPVSELAALFREGGPKDGTAGDLAKNANDYRMKQLFAVDSRAGGEDVSAIKLTAKGKELALAKKEGAWQFTIPAGWGDAAASGEVGGANPTAINGVRGLLNTVVNLQAATAADFIDNPGDLKQYGLNADNPDLIRVELKEKDATETALIGKKQEPAPKAEAGKPQPPAPPAQYYAKLEGGNAVLRVNPPPSFEALPGLIANPDPLRDRDLVKASDKLRIDAIDITVGGQTTKLRKSAGNFGAWKLYGGPNDPQTASAREVQKLLDLLAQPHVIKDFPAANDANFIPAQTLSEIKLWMDGVKPNADPKVDAKAEPKVEGPPILLQFGKKDIEGILVRRTRADGTKTECRLPEKVKLSLAIPPGGPPMPSFTEDVVVGAAVAKTRLDFLDPTLKSFASLLVSRLTIQKGTNITEVVREKPTEKTPKGEVLWKFVKPDAQKDHRADNGTISDLLVPLATESVVRFVAEAPTDADLAKWGLDPKNPKLKVTVGLESGAAAEKMTEEDKTRVYSFGNETDDKQYVYARQEGKIAVFTVPKLTAEKFASADLRDRTVVRFDAAKLKKVLLRGWKEKIGSELELVFEKKDGKWSVAKAPGKYEVDPAKLDKFVGVLDDLRAKAFIPGPAKPEYKLTPALNGLEVKLEIEGVPPITLNLGAATDGDTSLYLQSSSLPATGNIVTVVSEPFKTYKESSAAFAK